MGARPDPGAGELDADLARIEGFLLAEHEKATARKEAEEFAGRLPWLLGAQRDDVVRHFADVRLVAARRQHEAVLARSAQLREEYERRYRALRLRLIRACTAAVLTALPLAVAASCLVARHL